MNKIEKRLPSTEVSTGHPQPCAERFTKRNSHEKT